MTRKLDIGPGPVEFGRIPGFETLDSYESPLVDHVADCRRLPFKENAFDVVHSSHVIEHVDWWEVESTIAEWARVLKPGGRLEVWFPNGLKLMKAIVEFDETGVWSGEPPGNYMRKMHHDDPYKWGVGRLLNIPFKRNEGMRHRAVLTPRYVSEAMRKADMTLVRRLEDSERRGFDHGWINAGVVGVKP